MMNRLAFYIFEIDIDWAYADYRYRNWLGLRVGKVKKPRGLFNKTRDLDSERTCIFLPQSIYDDKNREASLASKGAGIYGTIPFGIEYEITHGLFDIPQDGGIIMNIQSGSGLDLQVDDIKPSTTGSILWNTPLERAQGLVFQ